MLYQPANDHSPLGHLTMVSDLRQALDGGEWAIVLLALAGLVYLSWVSWRAVRGRFVPVLMRDRLGADH